MKLITIILFTFALNQLAMAKKNDNSKNNPNSGKKSITHYKPTLAITPTLVPDYKVHSGEKARFDGSICVLKKHPHKENKASCQKPDINSQFGKYEVKFFYPDTNTEVTDHVSLINNEDSFEYKFETPKVSSIDLNRLTVLVQHNTDVSNFIQIEAKLKRHIELLEKKVSKGESKELEKLLNALKSSKEKVNDHIYNNPGVYARLDYPIQVDNKVAPPMEYFSIVSGIKQWMRITPGVSISGEKAHIEAKVSNINEKEYVEGFDDIEYKANKWRYWGEFFFNNELVHKSSEVYQKEAALFEYEFDTNALNAGDLSSFEIKVFRSKEVPEHAASYNMLQNQAWGNISYLLDIQTDSIAPQWSEESIISETQYFQNYPQLELEVSDQFGRLNKYSFYANLSGTLLDSTDVEFDLLSKLSLNPQSSVLPDQDGNQKYNITGNLNPLEEGRYILSSGIADFSGNFALPSPLTREFRIDRTEPNVVVNLPESILTNNPTLSFSVEIFDHSPVKTTIILNNEVSQESSDYSNNFSITLAEGLNSVEIVVQDAAGNTAPIYKNTNITLDTIPPEITGIFPQAGEIVRFLQFEVTGKSNEPLSEVKVNNNEVNIQESATNFAYMVTQGYEGTHQLEIQATDLAGNTQIVSHDYEVLLKLIRIDLVSIIPAQNGKIHIVGSEWSARPGQFIEISGGFFNSTNVHADQRGRFLAELDYATSITLEADDDELDRHEKYTLNYKADTTLSGIVKDTSGNPLTGVTVTIVNSGQSTQTDGSGVFSIVDPKLGVQKIKIDGGTIPEGTFNEGNGGKRSFGTVHINLNLGYKERNQLARPIYLSPLWLDGSETEIFKDQDAVVTSIHAPGVSLRIPAGMTSFNFPEESSEDEVDQDGNPIPDGDDLEEVTHRNVINISEIIRDQETDELNSSVAVPSMMKPNKIYAFEPSGLSFKEPVQLAVPNENNYEVGTELVVFSKNSATGKWEIDGAAKVISDDLIETVEGSGISHFSEIFVAPYGMDLKSASSDDKPGIDTDTSVLTRTIEMPSYKSMGQDITPTLVYKSKWAYPTALIKNVLDTKKEKVRKIKFADEEVTGLAWSKLESSLEIWTQPEYIRSKFYIADKESPEITYNTLGAPDKSLISYHATLDDLETGLYPAVSTYEIQYRNFTVFNSNFSAGGIGLLMSSLLKTPLEPDFFILDSIEKYNYDFDPQKVFAPSLIEVLKHQNKIDSEFGSGWHFVGAQKIVNPDSARLMLEEANGDTNVFVLDNSINTVYYDENGISAADFSDSDFIKFADLSGQVKSINKNGDPSSLLNEEKLSNYNFGIGSNKAWVYSSKKKCTKKNWIGDCKQTRWFHKVRCKKERFDYSLPKDVVSMFIDGSSTYYLDKRGAITRFDSGANSDTPISGDIKRPDYFLGFKAKYEKSNDSHCRSITGGIKCQNRKYYDSWTSTYKDSWRGWTPSSSYCGSHQKGNGVVPKKGDFSGYERSLAGARYNLPLSMTPSLTESGIIYVADTGNNKVKKINTNTGKVSLFAGNGETNENSNQEGENALDHVINLPRGVLADKQGNVFIATNSGQIKIVNQEGQINTIIGQNASGAPQVSSTLAKAVLNKPTGMVFSDNQKYLYIADTGNNRIVKADIENNSVTQVAGNGKCLSGEDNVQDGNSALNVSICQPMVIGLDQEENLFIIDHANKRIRKVTFNFSDTGIADYKSNDDKNSIIKRLGDGTFERVYRSGSIAKFNKQGLQKHQIDRVGNITTFVYEGTKLHQIIGPKGRISQLNYGADGKLESFLDPAERETFFYYENNNLTEVSFDKYSKRFHYNDKKLLLMEENEKGTTTEFIYNEWDRIEKAIHGTDPSTQIISEVQNGIFKSVLSSNDENNVSSYYNEESSNESPSITHLVDPKGYVTTVKQDLSGYLTEITDAKDRVTTIEKGEISEDILTEYYPNQANVKFIKITDHDNNTTEVHHNEYGETLYSYNSETQNEEIFNYNSRGQLVTYIDQEGRTKTRSYDEATGNLLKETDYNSNNTYRSYYNDGLIETVSNDNSEILKFEYNEHGNLNKRTSPEGEITKYERDSAGNIIKKIDANQTETFYTYNFFNQLTNVTTGVTSNDPIGKTTSYFYSPTGQLEKIIDPKGNETIFEYNELDQLKRKLTPLGQETLLAYDKAGNVSWEKDPNGNEKTFEFDSDNLLIKKTLPDNLYLMSYDDHGNLTNISDSDSSIQLHYEKVKNDYHVSRTITNGNDIPEVQIEYSYRDDGVRELMETPWGDFSYTHDDGGRLTSITNHRDEYFSFDYDTSNRIKQINRPGSRTVFAFDKNSFLKSIVHNSLSDSTISTLLYERDVIGNRTSITSERGIANFTYDSESQLKTTTNTEIEGDYSSELFSYDDLGNRLNDQIGNYQYDSKFQRLKEDYKNFYTFDNNGNMTSIQERGLNGNFKNLSYSSENQLIKIEQYKNNTLIKTSQYFYDALGRRMRKEIIDHQNSNNSFERKFIYDGQEILAELDEDNNTLGVYTHSSLRTDDVLAIDVQDTKLASQIGSYFYLKDGLGSIIDIVDSSGNLVQHYAYSSFGKILSVKDANNNEVISDPVVKTSYGFTNREHDEESGMMYYRARFYMPEIGRFIQEDPDSGSIVAPKSFNAKYIYVGNNPVQYVDPQGLYMQIVYYIGAAVYNYAISNAAANAMIYAAGSYIGGTIVNNEVQSKYTEQEQIPYRNPFQDRYDLFYKHSNIYNASYPDFDFHNPGIAPDGFEWRGKKGSRPGSKDGNWFNPDTGESLRPDLDHPEPIGEHWDYKDTNGDWHRIKPDGSIESKK